MKLIHSLIICSIAISACSVAKRATPAADEKVNIEHSNTGLQFLTRDGCRNTPLMLANLKAAIAARSGAMPLTIVRQEDLSPDDPRTGYPTPTILLGGRDIFGLAEPRPLFPEPA
ncbi:MAG: hypothetical protein ACK4S4_15060 [Pyrinomonadaceae bacterium]